MVDLCDSAVRNNVQVLIDAEETSIHHPIENVPIELMQIYNRKSSVIFLTHQCYRTGTLSKIKKNLEVSKEKKYFYGIKLVRGAYMEKERNRALQKGYNSPIQPSKLSTDKEYNENVVLEIDYWVLIPKKK